MIISNRKEGTNMKCITTIKDDIDERVEIYARERTELIKLNHYY